MKRLLSIDFLRGFVVLLMTIDHARYLFSTVQIGAPIGTDLPASYYFVRWVTHFCAPTFAFLAGLSMALRPLSKSGGTDRTLQQMLVKRGLFVILLSIVISIPMTTMFSRSEYTLDFGALWAIGGGMVFVALMMNYKPWIIAAVSLALVAGHHLLEMFDHVDSVLWSFLHVQQNFVLIENYINIRVSYPILPWLGIVGLGYVMGHYFFRVGAACENQRKTLLLSLGAGCILLFALLRYTNWYGDPNAFVASASFMQSLYSFLDVTKYPLSLLFALLTLSFSCFVLAFTDSKFFERPGRIVTLVSQYGQAALFYYVLHFFIILFYGYVFSYIFHDGELISSKSNYLGLTFIMTALVIVTAYPIIRLFTRLRHMHKENYPILAYL